MPRIKETTVFKYDELNEKAQERARDWLREANAGDNFFAECITEDFHEVLSAFGFSVDKKRGLSWSGFWSQGDGAAFDGAWYASDFAPEALLADRLTAWPSGEVCVLHTELHRIAAELKACKDAGLTSASITSSHRGFNMSAGDTYFDEPEDATNAEWGVIRSLQRTTEERFLEAARDLASWFYRALEAEYEYQNSDEAIAESIIANEYEFTEEGRIA